MANIAKAAIMRAKIEGVLTDLMVKTTADNVYVDGTTTLASHLTTLAAKYDVETLQQAVDTLGALAQKDTVSQDDLDEALAALIAGKAEASALDEVAGKVDTLIGDDSGKSVRTIASEELAAKLIGDNAKESLDSLEEIAAWIQEHPEDAAAMNAAIATKADKTDLEAYQTSNNARVDALEADSHAHANQDVLDGISAAHVTAWNGKGNIYYSPTEPVNMTENDLWFALVE